MRQNVVLNENARFPCGPQPRHSKGMKQNPAQILNIDLKRQHVSLEAAHMAAQ